MALLFVVGLAVTGAIEQSGNSDLAQAAGVTTANGSG
jgi:hypothetical protein